jgi:hypothetical protein
VDTDSDRTHQLQRRGIEDPTENAEFLNCHSSASSSLSVESMETSGRTKEFSDSFSLRIHILIKT